jgi:hypothetical protein
MKINNVESITGVKQGDMLLICSLGGDIQLEKVQAVKVSVSDGTEIIFDKRKNRFFNLDMYLQGKSWVKDVKVIKK